MGFLRIHVIAVKTDKTSIACFLNHTKTGMMLWFSLRKFEIEGYPTHKLR